MVIDGGRSFPWCPLLFAHSQVPGVQSWVLSKQADRRVPESMSDTSLLHSGPPVTPWVRRQGLWSLLFYFILFYFILFGIHKFRGQGSNPYQGSDLSCDNARSLTHCTTWELLCPLLLNLH